MGNVNCLWLEQQGTLTQKNKMKLESVHLFGVQSEESIKYPSCNYFVECIYFCSTAWVEGLQNNQELVYKGNWTE